MLKELSQLLPSTIELSNKIVVLHFWDQDCSLCMHEMPEIKETQLKMKSENVLFLGICMNQKGIDPDILSLYKIDWPQIALKWTDRLISILGVNRLPTILIFDKNQNIANTLTLNSKIKTVLNNLHDSERIDNFFSLPIASFTPPTKIEIKESPGKGAGVFAIQPIKKDEIIETCHLVSCLANELKDYNFIWNSTSQTTTTVLPLGYGAIYNHSEIPNATWQKHPSMRAFNFIALRDINPGEEICTYYGDSLYWTNKNVQIQI